MPSTHAWNKVGTGFTYQKDSGTIFCSYNPPDMSVTGNNVVCSGSISTYMAVTVDTITINGGAPAVNTGVGVQGQLMTDVF